METVISKISQIEEAANKIMEDAGEEKRAYSRKMEQRTRDFDRELESQTSLQLEALRSKKEQELKERLAQMRQDADSVIRQMEDHYAKNHDSYVDSLFSQMVGRAGQI